MDSKEPLNSGEEEQQGKSEMVGSTSNNANLEYSC